jgi:hypothetical protein
MHNLVLPFVLMSSGSGWRLVDEYEEWIVPIKYHRTTILNPGPGTLEAGGYSDSDQRIQEVQGSEIASPPYWIFWLSPLSSQDATVHKNIPVYQSMALEELRVQAWWTLHAGFQIWEREGSTPQSAIRTRTWHSAGDIKHWKQRASPE